MLYFRFLALAAACAHFGQYCAAAPDPAAEVCLIVPEQTVTEFITYFVSTNVESYPILVEGYYPENTVIHVDIGT